MSATSVIIRYAKSIYEAASKKGLVDIVSEDFSKIKDIMAQSKEIRKYCLRFHPDRLREMEFVKTAFIPYVSDLTGESLKLVVRNGRLAVLPYLPDAFSKIKDTDEGITEVILGSAEPAEKRMQDIIEEKMEKRLGQKVRLNSVVMPALIGGFRVLWNDRMIDMSVSGRIKRMRALIKAH